VRILAIRNVERIHSYTNLSSLTFGTFLERNAKRKVPVYFYVERKISREAETIGVAYIFLKDVQIRIREARVHVDDGAEDEAPKWDVDKTPDQ
jgi:hypothetical protein